MTVKGSGKYQSGITQVTIAAQDPDLADLVLQDIQGCTISKEGEFITIAPNDEPRLSVEVVSGIYASLCEVGEVSFDSKSDLVAIAPLIRYVLNNKFDVSVGESAFLWLQDQGGRAMRLAGRLLSQKSKEALASFLKSGETKA
jgi:hypothetical protein